MDKIKNLCKWCEEFRPLAVFFISVVAVSFFIYGIFTVWIWFKDTDPVVEFFGGEISAKVARPNDLLIVYLDLKKNKDCVGKSQRRLTGMCGEHILSEFTPYREAGFSGRIMITFQVPIEVIPGECAFQVHAWFVCNPFDLMRNRHYASSPIPFKVLRYDE